MLASGDVPAYLPPHPPSRCPSLHRVSPIVGCHPVPGPSRLMSDPTRQRSGASRRRYHLCSTSSSSRDLVRVERLKIELEYRKLKVEEITQP